MTALFCQSMNPTTGAGSPGRGRDLGASQQGAKGGSKLKNGIGRSMKKKKITLLDMTRANNISIVLARFDDVSLTKIIQAVCSLDAMGMSSEQCKALLNLTLYYLYELCVNFTHFISLYFTLLFHLTNFTVLTSLCSLRLCPPQACPVNI